MAQPCPQCNMRAQLLRGGRSMTSISRLPSGGSISTCSVAATYKPPMLVPRARLPAGALSDCTAQEETLGLGIAIQPARQARRMLLLSLPNELHDGPLTEAG